MTGPNKNIVSTSNLLSLFLRHQPEAIGMQFDPEGWLSIDELLENASEHGKSITLKLLHEVVANNDMKCFALSANWREG
jgi:putative RNA 2'-phosphotransferase